MLRAGHLNKRITISQPSTGQDEYGAPLPTPDPVHTCWAGIRAANGKEVYAASGYVSSLSHMVTIRYVPGLRIRPSMVVTYCDRAFLIQAVMDPDESREALQLLCLENVQ